MNSIPTPKIGGDDIISILRLLAKNTLFLPHAFLVEVKRINEIQEAHLLASHPNFRSHKRKLKHYFAPRLAIAYPFVRRLIASERKGLKSWLHRYHESSGFILDDNRVPKFCWSYAWYGTKNRFLGSPELRQYEASHLLPHKIESHESFVEEIFELHSGLDPNLLFLSVWNNLLVDKRLAGLTDNSPVITAVLLSEVQRRYGFDFGFWGKVRKRVLGHSIKDLSKEISWWQEPPDFIHAWSGFEQHRKTWIEDRLTNPKKRTAAVEANLI